MAGASEQLLKKNFRTAQNILPPFCLFFFQQKCTDFIFLLNLNLYIIHVVFGTNAI